MHVIRVADGKGTYINRFAIAYQTNLRDILSSGVLSRISEPWINWLTYAYVIRFEVHIKFNELL